MRAAVGALIHLIAAPLLRWRRYFCGIARKLTITLLAPAMTS
jgi:hypothetical protein